MEHHVRHGSGTGPCVRLAPGTGTGPDPARPGGSHDVDARIGWAWCGPLTGRGVGFGVLRVWTSSLCARSTG